MDVRVRSTNARRRWVARLPLEMRRAVRTLWTRRLVSAAVIGCIALGVGANTVMFDVVRAVFTGAPRGVRDPAHVRRITAVGPLGGDMHRTGVAFSYHALDQLARDSAAFPLTAGFCARYTTLQSRGDELSVRALYVTPNYFPLLGTNPAIGSLPRDHGADTARPRDVTLSDGTWRAMLGAPRDIIGDTVLVGGRPHVVTGVLPPGVGGIEGNRVDVWIPQNHDHPQCLTPGAIPSLSYWMSIVVRSASRLPLDSAARHAAHDLWGDRDSASEALGARIVLAPLRMGGDPVRRADTQIVLWAAGASVAILVLSIVSVAAILITMQLGRRADVATELALGASRARVTRRIVLEGTLLGASGALLAVMLVAVGGSAVVRLFMPGVVEPHDATLSVIALYALVIGIASGALASIAPARLAGRRDLTAQLAVGGIGIVRGRSSGHRAPLVLQVGLSFMLLVTASVFLRSLASVEDRPVGLDAHGLYYASIELNGPAAAHPVGDSLLLGVVRALDSLASIRRAALALNPLLNTGLAGSLTFTDMKHRWRPPGYPWRALVVDRVTDDYFRVLGVRILRGRSFEASDARPGHQVMVVSDSLAKALWSGRDPIGRRVHNADDTAWSTVVGVSADMPSQLIASSPFRYYTPFQQGSYGTSERALIVRSRVGRARTAAELRRVLHARAPGLTFGTLVSVEDWISSQVHPWRLQARALALDAFVAVVLTAIALWAQLAASVVSRRRELAVCMALGAEPATLRRGVVRWAVVLVVVGSIAGAVGALALGRVMSDRLFRVSPYDPWAFVVPAGVFLIVAFGASFGAARGITGIDPNEALRGDV